MRTYSILLAASLILLVGGCTGYGKYTVRTEKLTPTNKSDIRVYSITVPQGDYEVIGYISVFVSDAQDAGNELREKLKGQAAKLGATAIISFKMNQGTGGGGGAEGIAIRFK